MLSGQLALAAVACFSGAAVFVSVAEQPGRLVLDDRNMLVQWQHSYKTASVMQGGLALIASMLGFVAFWQTRHAGFLIGATLILANWPYVLIAIMPTNKKLHATTPEGANAETRHLIESWGRLHLVRSALGLAAMAAYLWASI
jgi:uncharacterized membrane protein